MRRPVPRLPLAVPLLAGALLVPGVRAESTAEGDAFAVHGFYSDGRHNVFYQRYKDFEQPWNDIPKARLAGMSEYRSLLGSILQQMPVPAQSNSYVVMEEVKESFVITVHRGKA